MTPINNVGDLIDVGEGREVNDNLVSMKDAAEYLGYSVDGLREIVDRSRRRANGSAVRAVLFGSAKSGWTTSKTRSIQRCH